MTVTSIEDTAKLTCSSRVGRFATLRAFLPERGTGVSSAPRGLLRALTPILTIAVALVLSVSPAFAVNTHVFSTAFAGSGSGAGQVALSSNSGVAVNSTTHDVYVADTGNFRVDQFTSSGTFVRAWGWGVGDGLPMLETCTLSCQAGVSGSGAGQFTKPTFVAVDNSAGASKGDVYVGDMGDNFVSKFSPEGVLLESWGTKGQLNGSTATAGSFGSIAGVAVDGAGTLDVINTSSHLFKFAQNGVFGEEFVVVRETSAHGLAVDSEGNIFKADGSPFIEEITGSGSDVGQVSQSQGTTGLAVDSASGDLYVDEGGDVEHYAFSGAGIVSEQGATTCKVEPFVGCPATDAFGSGHLGAGAGIAVDPSTHTVYVADASNQRISVFTGPVIVPDATTEAATGVSVTAATLHGTVNPDETSVTGCEFEYRTETEVSFTHTIICAQTLPLTGKAPVAVSANLTGLAANTAYQYRLAATNTNGTNYGSSQPFLTPGPPRIDTESFSGVGPTRATLSAKINPDGFATHYHFEYDTTEYNSGSSHGTSVPIPDGEIPTGFAEQEVSINAIALQPNTTYHFRVIASNAAGPPVDGADQTFTTQPPVLIDSESASNVTATSATLEAQLNPLGANTSAYFQYGTVSCTTSPTSCTDLPVPPGTELGSNETDQTLSAHLQDLNPGTIYHYRVLATNTLGTTPGPDQTFTTQTAGVFALPDSRVWELVSPADKHGALAEPISRGVTQAAADGEGITYLARSPTEADTPGNSNQTQVLSARSGAVVSPWVSKDISTPREVANGFKENGEVEPQFFSSDLSDAVIQPWGAFNPSLSSEASEQTAYLRTNFLDSSLSSPCLSSCYRPLVTGAPGFANVPAGSEFGEGACHPVQTIQCGPSYEGASPDGSHIVLASKSPLSKGASAGSLYEWSGGRLEPVSVLPASEGGGVVEGVLGSAGVSGGGVKVSRTAVSADGSRVVWEKITSGSYSGSLYVRDLSSGGSGETVRIGTGADFQGASSDGTRVVFTEGGDLKIFDAPLGDALSAGHVTDLVPGAKVIGIVPGISEDASSIYFVANAVLSSTPSPNGEHAVTGNCTGSNENTPPPGALCDLYEWHGGAIRLVAVLSGDDDEPVWLTMGEGNGPTARVSPDGEWFAFMSDRSITGYDNRDAVSGQRDEEVYLYHAGTGALVCASCNPTGARPHGAFDHGTASVTLLGDQQRSWAGQWLAASVPGWTTLDYQARYLFDSGRLFFNGNDALIPSDSGGTEDVYQYEPPGVGSCTSTDSTFNGRADGCVDLISSGTAKEGAAFMDASESGDDVFFLTSGQLSARDSDALPDVYDARVGGGVPVAQQVPACEGDACQSPAIAPNDPTPGSLTFKGPGNATPAVSKTPATKAKRTVAQIRVEKLARSLRACRKLKSRMRRRSCEKQARRKYGSAIKTQAKEATNGRRAK